MSDARWLLLALGCCWACSDPVEEFHGTIWSSSRVRYHARDADPQACAGVVQAIEQRSDRFAELLGTTPARWEPIDYYKFFDAEDAARHSPCEASNRACAKRSQVWSTRALHDHELAHVVLAGLAGDGPPFLEEGFVVALTCDPSANGVAPDAPLATALDVSTASGYVAAGRLVGGLWAAGTPEQLLELERRLGTTTPDAARLAEEVRDIYGLEVDAVWSEAKRSAGCLAQPFCDAPPLALGETLLQDGCTGRSARLVSRELGGALGIQSAGLPLVLRACAAGAPPGGLSRLQLGGVFEAPWRTETWFVPPVDTQALFQVEDDQSGSDTVLRTRDLGSAFAATCDTGAATELLPDTELAIAMPPEPGVYHFVLRGLASQAFELSLVGSSPSALQVSWCDACPEAAAASCATLELSQPKPVELASQSVLRVELKAVPQQSVLLRLVPSAP